MWGSRNKLSWASAPPTQEPHDLDKGHNRPEIQLTCTRVSGSLLLGNPVKTDDLGVSWHLFKDVCIMYVLRIMSYIQATCLQQGQRQTGQECAVPIRGGKGGGRE